MADLKFYVSMTEDNAGDANALVNIKVGGTTIATGQTVSSTDANSPTVVTAVASGINADGNLDFEVEFTNPYYVDSDNDRNVMVHRVAYTTKLTEYPAAGSGQKSSSDTSKDTSHAQIAKDRGEIDSDQFPIQGKWAWNEVVIHGVDNSNVTWNTLHVDGSAVDISGYTQTDGKNSIITCWEAGMKLNFAYALGARNVPPYRAWVSGSTYGDKQYPSWHPQG